jgi:hypothetical protein
LPTGRGLTLKDKGFAQRYRFTHERERFCKRSKKLTMKEKCFAKEVEV